MIYFLAMTSLMGAQFKADFFFTQILLFAVYNVVTGLFLFYILDRSRPWVHRRFPNQVFQPI
jgi:hypothetical protein